MEEQSKHAKTKKPNVFKKFGSWFKGLKTWKKVVLIVVLVLLVLGGTAYGLFSSKLNMMDRVKIDSTKLSMVDVDGYINILLLGVDTRDMSNISGSRSDAIMVVSINTKSNEVKVASVYRDTYLKMGDTETYDKITHACVYGGPEMTVKSLNQALDLNISNFVVVNFKAVADLVDAVGGITVDVQPEEIEQLNKYTIQTAKNIGQKDYQLVEKSGKQKIIGVQAVSYGRIRKGVGDDYKRTERMRIVLTKVFNKMKTMNVSQLNDIINLMLPQVQTTLSNSDILGLALKLGKYNISGSYGFPENRAGGLVGGVSYVFPDDLASSVVLLHKEMFNQESYSISSICSQISNEIISRRAAENAPAKSTEKTDKTTKTDKTDKVVKDNTEKDNTKVDPEDKDDTGDDQKVADDQDEGADVTQQ